MKKITTDMLIGDILKIDGGITPILMEIGMHCLGCPSSQSETLQEACLIHNVNADTVAEKINLYLMNKN